MKKILLILGTIIGLTLLSGCTTKTPQEAFYYNEQFGFSLIVPKTMIEYEVNIDDMPVASNAIKSFIFTHNNNNLVEVSIFDLNKEIRIEPDNKNNKFAFLITGITNLDTGVELSKEEIETIKKNFRVYDIN
jgi:hypothetical protein